MLAGQKVPGRASRWSAVLAFSYDVSLYHTQIGEVADLAAALPNTRIVLNHVGGVLGLGSYPQQQEEVFSRWRHRSGLAAAPTVFVKLGGLVKATRPCASMGTQNHHRRKGGRAIPPYVETCITPFGRRRCMFESNFPVDKISYSYPVFWNACKLMGEGRVQQRESRSVRRFRRRGATSWNGLV